MPPGHRLQHTVWDVFFSILFGVGVVYAIRIVCVFVEGGLGVREGDGLLLGGSCGRIEIVRWRGGTIDGGGLDGGCYFHGE